MRDPEDDDDLPVRQRSTPKRRPRMGQVIASLGPRATATATGASLAKELVRRDMAAKAKALLEGGRNKGEEKGYGATAGKVIKP